MGVLTAWRGGGCAGSPEMEAEGQACGDGGAVARVTLDARVNSPISSLVSAAEATAAASVMAAQPSRPQRGDTGVC